MILPFRVVNARADVRPSMIVPGDIYGSGTSNDNLYYTGTPGQVFNPGSGLGYPDLTKLAEDFVRHS